MNWNNLKVFLQITETGSLSGAAKVLKVNHSTVYRNLQEFEKEIGVKLFEVDKNVYALTPTGLELLKIAKEVSLKIDDIERVIIGRDLLPKGNVKITAPPNLANRTLPTVLVNLKKQYPDITVEIISCNEEINMNSRIADIALRATIKPPDHLIGKKITDIKWGIFASAAYLDEHPKITSHEELDNHQLIGGSGQMMTLPAFQWLEKNYKNQIGYRADELTTMAKLAQNALGITFLPFDHQRSNLKFIADFPPGKVSELWLLIHPNLRKSLRMRIVMNATEEHIKNHCVFDSFLSLE